MKIKIGVVGTGKVARQNYVPCLAAAAAVELGYYSRTGAKAEAIAAEFGGRVFDSAAALVDWEPDAILILTRETERLEAASEVLKANPRRLFFEKPLVARHGQADVREEDFFAARELLQEAAERQCETAMVFNYRFFDQSLRARELISARDFGQVLNISGLVHYACWSHCIDLVHHFGDPIVQLTALQSARKRGERVAAQDVSAAFCTAADATGTLIGTAALAWELPLFELHFNFERGRIHFRDLDGDMEVLDGRSGQHEIHAVPRDRSRWDQYNASFFKSTLAYLESVRQGQPPPVPGVAGLQELQVEAAIKRSIARRRPVDLEAELPLKL